MHLCRVNKQNCKIDMYHCDCIFHLDSYWGKIKFEDRGSSLAGMISISQFLDNLNMERCRQCNFHLKGSSYLNKYFCIDLPLEQYCLCILCTPMNWCMHHNYCHSSCIFYWSWQSKICMFLSGMTADSCDWREQKSDPGRQYSQGHHNCCRVEGKGHKKNWLLKSLMDIDSNNFDLNIGSILLNNFCTESVKCTIGIKKNIRDKFLLKYLQNMKSGKEWGKLY